MIETTPLLSGAQPAGPDYAALLFDSMKLLLPYNEVLTVESVLDMHKAPFDKVGQLTNYEQPIPVYCLTQQLTLTSDVPNSRRIIVLFSTEESPVGILCDELGMIRNQALSAYPLPACMVKLNSPVNGIVILDDTIACLSRIARLAPFLLTASEQRW